MPKPIHNDATLRQIPLNDLMVTDAWADCLRAANLDTLDGLFAVESDTNLHKPGLGHWRERVETTVDKEGASQRLYIKRYSNPPGSALREVRRNGCGAKSVAGVEWNWMHRLRLEQIPGPMPVALGEAFEGRREMRSVVVMAEVPGDALERISLNWSSKDRPLIREVMMEAAYLIARLHAAGLVHRDLYLSHLFCDSQASNGQRLHLIDLQRVFKPACCQLRWIVKDLAALNFSTPQRVASRVDRLRFLKSYLQQSNLDVSVRPLAYRVIGKTLAIARHDLKRSLRLSKGRIA